MIYFIDNSDVPFVSKTIFSGIEGLSKYGYETKKYSHQDIRNNKLDKDSSNCLFCIDIGNVNILQLYPQKIREYFPNCKIVAIGADAWAFKILHNKWQMKYPEEVDLHLDVMPQAIGYFRENGMKAEMYLWTISEELKNWAESCYVEREKIYDFIGVYHPVSIENKDCWRHHAVKYIRNEGYTFTRGNGSGHHDNDFEDLFKVYTQSKFTLGTTSHNNPALTKIGCMKGFRDWLGPVLGSVLIYDSHFHICKYYNDYLITGVIPTYNYNNFQSIIDLANTLIEFNSYGVFLERQKRWIEENTLDKQFLRIFREYQLI